MKREGQRTLSLLLVFLLLVSFALTGCAQDGVDGAQKTTPVETDNVPETTAGPITLRVLTEKQRPLPNEFTKQFRAMVKQFEKAHENVEIELVELANNPEDRDIQLDQLRVEIMAGKGPDIFLLPTGHQSDPTLMHTLQPLFPDVNQAMHNGMFADIGAYYDADAALGKAGLNTAVMNAGVVDGGRYALPLRYDFPVAYVNVDALEAAGLGTDMFEQGVVHMLDAIRQHGDPVLAKNAYFYMGSHVANFLPELLDYENQQLLATEEEVTDIIDSYLAVQAMGSDVELGSALSANGFFDYIDGQHWLRQGEFMNVATLDDAPREVAFAQLENVNLAMYPLTGADGKVVAEVELYGAVGGGSDHPELGYDFLRLFLAEQVQWEADLVDTAGDHMVATGYVVRTAGSAGPYFSNICKRVAHISYSGWYDVDGEFHEVSEEDNQRFRDQLNGVVLTDDDVPLLQTTIDVARFPLSELEFEFGRKVSNALYHTENGDPAEVDAAAMAAEFIEELRWHLLEG